MFEIRFGIKYNVIHKLGRALRLIVLALRAVLIAYVYRCYTSFPCRVKLLPPDILIINFGR